MSFTRSSGTRLANLFKSFTEVEKKLPAQLCQLVKGLKGRVPGAYACVRTCGCVRMRTYVRTHTKHGVRIVRTHLRTQDTVRMHVRIVRTHAYARRARRAYRRKKKTEVQM